MELDEVDPRLVALLRGAGDEWGPLGVARVAAQLCGHQVVPEPEPPPDPIVVKFDDWGSSQQPPAERSWLSFESPTQAACVLGAVAGGVLLLALVAICLVAIL